MAEKVGGRQIRRASLTAFVAGLLLYPFALYLTMDEIAGAFTHAHPHPGQWRMGRILSVLSVVLLASSIALAFFVPPSRERKRMWWAVPAAVIAIVVVYFDWLGFGF